MLSEEQRATLIKLSKDPTATFIEFHQEMIGNLMIGGMSGYLGIYATCAIETEEEGHNELGHKRKDLIEKKISLLNSKISKLNKGKSQFYNDDSDHHWTDFIANFLEFHPIINEFFNLELSEVNPNPNNSITTKLHQTIKAFEKFENKALTCAFEACKIISQANKNSFSINEGVTPSPKVMAQFQEKIKELQNNNKSPNSTPNPQSAIKFQEKNLTNVSYL